jgi:hypothetical protein
MRTTTTTTKQKRKLGPPGYFEFQQNALHLSSTQTMLDRQKNGRKICIDHLNASTNRQATWKPQFPCLSSWTLLLLELEETTLLPVAAIGWTSCHYGAKDDTILSSLDGD